MKSAQTRKGRPAFREIYQEYIGFMQYAVSLFRLPIQVQEDLIQETFIRYLEVEKDHEQVNPKHFLLAVLRNLAIDYYRKQ